MFVLKWKKKEHWLELHGRAAIKRTSVGKQWIPKTLENILRQIMKLCQSITMMKSSRFPKLSKRTLVWPPTQETNSCSKVPRSAFSVSRLFRKKCVLKWDQTNICFTSTGWKEAQAHPWSSGRVWASTKYQDHSKTYSGEFPRFARVWLRWKVS